MFGQALSGISGTVTDSSGAIVPNATVTVTNNATAVTKTAVTSSAGTYTVTDLIPGTYTVKMEAPGFQLSMHNGVGVEVAKVSTVDAVLEPGNTQQTVTVTESAIALDTTQPQLNTTIENKVVQELPNQLPGGRGRQIDQFIFLAPGVTGDTFSHRINGGVDFQNEVVFNGIPMAQSETQGFQSIWNPPFELVNQFNVLRSSFSAQYGLAQGVVTYQTASGTNQFHGDVFEILRNNFFDARGAYNEHTPIDKEHNYGFTIAGPVWIPKLYNGKNRTFFHLSMEWYRQDVTDTSFISLPTAAEKAGDFSGLTDSSGKQVVIYNPVNSGCMANGNTPGTPFRGNVIPQACFSPNSASLLQFMPDPSLPGFSNNQQSLRGVIPTRQNPWGFTIDHNITDRQSIHWAEWRTKRTSYGTETDSRLPTSNPLTSNIYQPDLGTVFILNYSNTLSPHLVMTAGASWLGELNSQISQRTSVPNFAPAPNTPQMPLLNFSGNLSPSELGSPWTESINRKLGIVIDNNWLWVRGKQTFNIGWEARRTYQDDNECQQCAGRFDFSNNQTADPNYVANDNLGSTGNSFASFLLGTVDSARRVGSQELRLHNSDVSVYIQDDIRWNPRFTFNLGVRWDIMVPFSEKNNNIVYFDPSVPNPGADGRLGAAQQFGFCIECASYTRADVHWNHFSPRTGFSYQLNSKTVLQGGAALNYLNGGAYEYGISKVAVNYGNLLLGSFNRNSTGSPAPGFGSWDTNVLPYPSLTPFSPSIGNGHTINGFDRANDGVAPYNIAWSIGVQRELPGNMFLSASYAGNRSNHLPSQLNPPNQLAPVYLSQFGSLLGENYTSVAAQTGVSLPYSNFLNDLGSSASLLQALRPYPQYADIFDNFDMTGASLYNALQVQAEKRYTNGLSFLVSYNLSKMMSNTNSGFTSFAAKSLNKDNQKAEWSIDNNDKTNMISIAGTYELPFGKGRPFLNHNGFLTAIVGGWQISPLLTYSTGTPLWTGNPGGSVNVSGDPLGNNCAPCNRANLVSTKNIQFSYNNVYKGLPVINAADFTDPGPWVLGNAPRVISQLRNPWGLNENIAVAKYFNIGEHVRAKLEMEYFNVLNRLIFGGPTLNFNDANFGLVIRNQANTQRQGQAHFEVRF